MAVSTTAKPPSPNAPPDVAPRARARTVGRDLVHVSSAMALVPPITADEIALLRTYLHHVIDKTLSDDT